jgi:hypothetical protein
MSSGCVREYTMLGNVRINSRQVLNTTNPAFPSSFGSKRACIDAMPANREPAPFSLERLAQRSLARKEVGRLEMSTCRHIAFFAVLVDVKPLPLDLRRNP